MKTDWLPIILFLLVAVVVGRECVSAYREKQLNDQVFNAWLLKEKKEVLWQGRCKDQIPADADGRLIAYGYELVAHTANYLGPKGTVARLSNGMNCQNCHLNGGTIPYGNNFGKVASTYPQFRARNNGIQRVCDRVNDCFERSLNGIPPDSNSLEMKAICAYIQWLGEDVPKGSKPAGTGIMRLEYLDRAASPVAGEQVYVSKCQRCHGHDGEGVADAAGNMFIYPPLWGEHSYNDGAGLFRLSNFAGFVKNNMPFGADHHQPQLTTAEAWDVAAFVNSRPRPHKDQHNDWKDLAGKPVDFPFAPYIDTFTEQQHKYGPFEAMNK